MEVESTVSLDHTALMRRATEAYFCHYDDGDLQPAGSFLPYDFDDEVGRYKWRMMANMLVVDELREVTNILNGWQAALLQWHAWNRALEPFDEQECWGLRKEFVEAVAHQCLLQPASSRDAIVFAATNSLHQVRLVVEDGYRDHLDGDPEKPGRRPRHLPRKEKEKRLKKLMAPWRGAGAWFFLLDKIDDEEYRGSTFDYRNRFAHAIAPRLGVGHVGMVTRSVAQATEMKAQKDGTYRDVPIPGKMYVRYGFGGTPPLDMEVARKANMEQYLRTRACFLGYRDILSIAMADMPKRL